MLSENTRHLLDSVVKAVRSLSRGVLGQDLRRGEALAARRP
jgi:hypothetical protein